jgi:CheY-like chemotaxis protein
MIDHVFKPFVQAPQGRDRREGGLGLGLAVVHLITQLHGGSVEVSNAEGKGARFRVRLPASAPVKRERKEAAPAVAPRRLRVLVVEDGDDAREMLQALLTLHGHEVVTAATGAEALAAFETFDADVVLLDIGLPDMDGYEVARRLRASDPTHAVRLVALTGYGQSEDENRAYQAGCDLHITKPVEPQSLARLLADLSATATNR